MERTDTRTHCTLWRALCCFSAAVLGAVAFSTRIEVSSFAEHSNITLADNTLLWSLLTLLLTAFYLRTDTRSRRRDTPGLAILSLLFGYLNVIGHSMFYLDSWRFLLDNLYQLLLGSMCALGYAALFFAVGVQLFSALDRGRLLASPADRPAARGPLAFYERRPALGAAIVLACCYLVWLLVFYPGCTGYDVNYQLRQFFGLNAWTNSHPVASTAIVGSCMWLGKLFGSDNLGMFFYRLLQASVFVLVFSQTVATVRRLGGSRLLQAAVLLFFAVMPMWGAFAVQGYKDGLFAGVFAGFVLLTLRMALSCREGKTPSVRDCLLYGAAAVAAGLLRSAVVFAVLATLLGMALFLSRGAVRGRMALTAAAVAAVSLGFIYLVLPLAGVLPANRAESLSIPFQQTARTVRDHGDTVTAEERAAIDGVLDYDALPKAYMAVLSDPVKDTYHQRDLPTEEESLRTYLKTWLRMGLKYPGSYLQATLGNSFGYYSFTPSIQTSNGNTAMCFTLYCGDANGVVASETYTLRFPESTAALRSLFTRAAHLVDALPGVNLLYACAFYFWGTLLIALYALRRRQSRYLVVLLPVLLLLFGCIGTAVNDSFRYALPAVAAFPTVLLCGLLAARDETPLDGEPPERAE